MTIRSSPPSSHTKSKEALFKSSAKLLPNDLLHGTIVLHCISIENLAKVLLSSVAQEMNKLCFIRTQATFASLVQGGDIVSDVPILIAFITVALSASFLKLRPNIGKEHRRNHYHSQNSEELLVLSAQLALNGALQSLVIQSRKRLVQRIHIGVGPGDH
jgi:hypothetical protein